METALIAITGIGSFLIAGTFFAFSVFVMRALAALPDSAGIAAMQSINTIILRTIFIPVFVGTALLCLAVSASAAFWWHPPRSLLVVAGAVLYLLGSFGVTAAFNVPRNNILAQQQPETPQGRDVWRTYISEWTFWNHVRTIASLAAGVFFMAALLYPRP